MSATAALAAMAKLQEERAEPDIRIVSSQEFIAGFVPPDYLIDNILQRRFIYSMTAPTGGGKTAIALRIAAHHALGKPIGEHAVEQGRVLFLAGENPDDLRMRWMAMAALMGFDAGTIDVHFIPGVFDIDRLDACVRQALEALGGVTLVCVDTSATYFKGESENDNVQMGNHARTLRRLTTLPGAPCVIICCHPTKNAGNDSLLPRGGGAFIAEMDGNLVCLKSDGIVDLHWQGKYRGPDFEPLSFQLETVTVPELKDSKGRNVPTVWAKPLSDQGRSDLEALTRSDENQVLLSLEQTPGTSIAGVAEKLNWRTGKGKPYKSRVQRAIEKLKRSKLVSLERDRWQLTSKGKAEATRIRNDA